MARKYSKAASDDVGKALHREKRGTLKSGKGGKGGKVKSRAQAIAIGLSEARAEGKKAPTAPAKKSAKKTAKKAGKKKSAAKKSTAKKSAGKKKSAKKATARK